MAIAEEILERTQLDSHFVQLYEADDSALARNVGKYLADGLALGGDLVLCATADHRRAFSREIERRGWHVERLERDGRLTWLDASETLARLMANGHPDAERFDRVIGETVKKALANAGDGGLRAYGDMVGLLWQDRQFPAAIRLEQLWNRLRRTVPFSLFCAYPVDIFGGQFDVAILDALLCAHTHLLPTDSDGHLDRAVSRAIAETIGADEARTLSVGNRERVWANIPKPEAAILWLRNNAPDRADEILALARKYYYAT